MLSTELLAVRRKRLAKNLENSNLDAVAIVPGANLYFLTGLDLHLMERPTVLIFFADGSMRAVIPALEKARWQTAMNEVATEYWQDCDGFDDAFAKAAQSVGPARIGVEGQRMRVFEYQALLRGFSDSTLVDAERTIADLRLCKDEFELSLMEKAIRISERVLSRVVESLHQGLSEREVQNTLKAELLKEGAEGFAFEPIVLSGPNSANPHGIPSDKCKLELGHALLFDFGASFGGYHADITRTFFCGHVSDKHRKIYNAVLCANEIGRAECKPGNTADHVDKVVSESMRTSGFADFIVHRTGHGLGLYVHEEPQVMRGNNYQLEAGNVLTIEPGLYIPNEIGVRIEDDVVVTRDGCQSLTEFPRDLAIF